MWAFSIGPAWLCGIAGALLFIALLALLRSRYVFWQKQGAKLQVTGYLPPPPSLFARICNLLMSRLAGKWMIGPVRVYGKENIPTDGRVLFTPTHCHAFDFATLLTAVPFLRRRIYRTIAASSELKGLRGTLGAWTGTFGVNKQDPHDQRMKAVEAAAECLVPDPAHPEVGEYTSLLWFPTGLLYKQAENLTLKPAIFKGNWARVATLAAERAGDKPVYVLPVALYYNLDLSRAPWLIRRLSKKYRNAWGDIAYGATVVFGKPILVRPNTLPHDEAAARQFACDILQPLVDEARAIDAGKPSVMPLAQWLRDKHW